MAMDGMIGKKIKFEDWKGDTRTGEVVSILKNGDYEVSTDRGMALVKNAEIIKMRKGGYVPKSVQMKREKVAKVMHEFKEGKLHSGSKKGPIVKDRDQAIAIALAEANSKKMAKGGGIEQYQESKHLIQEQWEKWNEWVKTGKIDGKKENNIFAVARWVGAPVAHINAYEMEQRRKRLPMSKGGGIDKTEKMGKIKISDIVSGAKFKAKSGTVFIVDSTDGKIVESSLEGGSKGNYRDPIGEFVAFMNEMGATKIMSTGGSMYVDGGAADGGDIYVPVNKEVTKERIDDFVNYVEMFYGKDEDAMGKDGYTKAQIRTAVKKYLMDLERQKAYTWGNGDSLDRERVFPYLMNPSQKGIKNPSLAKGGALSSFNPKSFTLDELKDYLWENDIWFSGFQKGWSGITPASQIENLWDGTSHSLVLKKWKDKKLTISDYGHLEVEKGSENLYLDLIVYELDGSDDPYTIRIYTKENHKGLKEFANHIIDKFKKGGAADGGEFVLDDKVVWTYDVYDRSTKKDMPTQKIGVIKSYYWDKSSDNPLKIYEVTFADGSEEQFLDKSHPESKRYFGQDIKELSKSKMSKGGSMGWKHKMK